MRAATEEVRRQRAEHTAAARLLGRDAPEIAVDDERSVCAIEPAELVALRTREQLGRHDLEGRSRGRRIGKSAIHGAKNKRSDDQCQEKPAFI